MTSVVLLSVGLANAIMLFANLPRVVMLNVIMLSVDVLSATRVCKEISADLLACFEGV
jgi:hypothetical protein